MLQVRQPLRQVEEPATFDLYTLGVPLGRGAQVLLQLVQWREGRWRRAPAVLDSLDCIVCVCTCSMVVYVLHKHVRKTKLL